MPNKLYHPGDFVRVTLAVARQLIWHKFDLWLCRAGVELGAIRPLQLAYYNMKLRFRATVQSLRSADRYAKLSSGGWHETETESTPINWQIICDNVLDGIIEEYRDTFIPDSSEPPRTSAAHYYYEHPQAVGLNVLSMAIDHTKEAEGWHDRPEGALAVIHYDAFRVRCLHKEGIALFLNSLPRWTVYAPASLMMRATTAPTVSVNTRGLGRRRIYQEAFRLADIQAACRFAGIPWFVYFREVHPRYYPKVFRHASTGQSGTHD